jgi:hypothetical protein
MKKCMLWVFAVLMLGGAAVRAQDMAGNWQGTMATPNGEYRIVLAISKADNGGWSATAYAVDANGQPLHDPVPGKVIRQDSGVKVTITADEGSFEGKLSEDGKSIVGIFDVGEGLPLNLVRATPETAWSVQGMPAAQTPELPSGGVSSLKPGAEILSDTMGVDFSGYMRRLHNDIQRNWNAVIPAKVNPPVNEKGIVAIRFAILPDGRIGSMKLEGVSGDVDLDKAAWMAITSEGQFPALPTAFHGPQLEVRVGFFYNTPVK